MSVPNLGWWWLPIAIVGSVLLVIALLFAWCFFRDCSLCEEPYQPRRRP